MPRRPYTVTAKVLAACRTNLQKANAVPKSLRYRPTPRRLAACRRNLEKAHATLRAAGSHSPAYGTSFRHGLYCVLLGRSLELAGESREDFREHIELFDRAFAPRDHEEARLVRAIAETAWRRLRAFRGQARWERLAIRYRLAEAAEKPRAGDPAARGEALAWGLVAILARDYALMGWLGRLSHRMKRLCRVLIEKRLGETGEAPEISARPRDTALFSMPLAALSNPFLTPSRVARALEPPPPGELKLKPVGEWWWRGAEEIRASREPLDDPLPGEARELDYGLVRREREIEASGEHDGLAAYKRLFERAFGIEAAEGGVGAVPLGGTSPLRLKTLARLAWERVEVYRREAEQEQENLKRLLEAAAATRRVADTSFADVCDPEATATMGTSPLHAPPPGPAEP